MECIEDLILHVVRTFPDVEKFRVHKNSESVDIKLHDHWFRVNMLCNVTTPEGSKTLMTASLSGTLGAKQDLVLFKAQIRAYCEQGFQTGFESIKELVGAI